MWYFLLGVLLVAADQAVKLWTAAAFTPPSAGFTATSDAPIPLIPGAVELTRVHNYGAAWSSFSGQRWLLLILTCAIVAGILFLLIRGVIRHRLGRLAAVLVASGGIGNIIDRLRLGYVVDMFHFVFWPDYPVFNAADVCVVCGAVLGVVYYLWFHEKKEAPDGDADASV